MQSIVLFFRSNALLIMSATFSVLAFALVAKPTLSVLCMIGAAICYLGHQLTVRLEFICNCLVGIISMIAAGEEEVPFFGDEDEGEEVVN